MTNTVALERASWRKSTRSSNGSAQCVEVACLNEHRWVKSTRSSNGSGQCVEVAPVSGVVAIRDSKHCEGHDYPVLTVSQSDWSGFLASVR